MLTKTQQEFMECDCCCSFQVIVIPNLLARECLHQEVTPKYLESSTSNVYSVFELKLLTWINDHFKLHRETLFGSEG